jgi:hypothetical protein
LLEVRMSVAALTTVIAAIFQALAFPPHMFTAAKDAVTAAAIRRFLSGKMERYGTVRDLRFDSRARSLEIVCDLVGETEPVTVRVGSYTVEETAGQSYLRPKACTCSRPWITRLLEDYVEGKRFEVPGWAKAAL